MVKTHFALALVIGLSLGVAACSEDNGGDDTRPSCAQMCARIEAPQCENAAPDCLAACAEDLERTPESCEPQLDALSTCFARATFTCDQDGIPVADDCAQQLAAWTSCLDQNLGGDGDGDGDGELCAPAQEDNACDSCLKVSCCEEVSACSPACQVIVDCVSLCEDNPCIDACFESNPQGAQEAAALFTCVGENCAAPCAE